MLSASIILSGLIQMGVPLLLAFFLVRRYHTEWRLVGIGVLVYVVYQVVILPAVLQALAGTEVYVNQIESLPQLTVALLIWVISAVIEQGASLGGFYLIRRSIAAWKDGLGVTAGHAGAGSLGIGLVQLINFAFVVSTPANTQSLSGLSAQEALNLQKYLEFYWAQPWYLPLSEAMQSLTLMMLQIALGMMVWLAFTRSSWVWVGASVLWQTAVNGVILAVSTQLSVVFSGVAYVVFFLINAGILYFLYRKIHPDALPIVKGVISR